MQECYQRGSRCSKGCLPTPSSHAGEAGDTGDVVCNLMDEVASLEDALSQMGASLKHPSTSCDAADHHLTIFIT